ncbi:MAG: LbtU family siderophore porin [Thiohalocapsa sp.]|nr:LbtU family siderophore porin [Thiohalocapsa sp.]
MTQHCLSAGIALALTAAVLPQAQAQTLEERVLRLERENREQAAALERQDATIAEQKQALEGAPERLEAVEGAMDSDAGGNWFENIEIAGLIEVEAAYVDPFEGSSESDIVLATFELGIASQVTDWVEIGAALLYEEDDTPLEVDIAYATIYNPDVSPVYFTAGQVYVPFGAYETNLVSDPLTLEIGEARETAAELGFIYEGFSGSVYAFNGDNKVDGENEIGSWGANLAFSREQDGMIWTVGAGYISDLGDSDSLQDGVADNREARLEELLEAGDPAADDFSTDPTERTGGWTVNAAIVLGSFNLIGEYLSAAEEFDDASLAFGDHGAKPSAWNIEAGFGFEVLGRESVAAIAYQGTDEALALELPKERWLVGWSIGIFDNTALSFEYSYDTDYSESDGGTGENGSAFVAQLAVEF